MSEQRIKEIAELQQINAKVQGAIAHAYHDYLRVLARQVVCTVIASNLMIPADGVVYISPFQGKLYGDYRVTYRVVFAINGDYTLESQVFDRTDAPARIEDDQNLWPWAQEVASMVHELYSIKVMQHGEDRLVLDELKPCADSPTAPVDIEDMRCINAALDEYLRTLRNVLPAFLPTVGGLCADALLGTFALKWLRAQPETPALKMIMATFDERDFAKLHFKLQIIPLHSVE